MSAERGKGGSSALSGVAWNSGVGALTIVVNLAAIPLGVSAVGSALFGSWAVGAALLLLLSQFDFGLSAGVVQRVAYYRGIGDESALRAYLSSTFILFLLLASALSFAACIASWLYLDRWQSVSSPLLMIIAIGSAMGTFIGILLRFQIALFQGFAYFARERLASGFGQLARLLILALAVGLGVRAGWPEVLLLVAVVSADIVALALPLALLSIQAEILRIGALWRQKAQIRMLYGPVRSSLPIFVSSFATFVAMQAPLYIAGAILPATSMPVVAGLVRIYQSSRAVLGWASYPALPLISHTYSRGDSSNVRKLAKASVTVCTCVGLAVGLPLLAAGPNLLTLWLGPGAAGDGAGLAARMLGVCIVVNALYSPLVVAATGVAKPERVVLPNLLIAMLVCASAPLLISWLGIAGVGLSSLLPLLLVAPWGIRAAVRSLAAGLASTIGRASLAALSAVSVGFFAVAITSGPSGAGPRDGLVSFVALGLALVSAGLVLASDVRCSIEVLRRGGV